MKELKLIAKKILEEAERQGADFAACSVGESETREFNVTAGELSLMRTLFDKSISVSIYKNGKKGSVSTTGFEDEKLTQAVKDACEAAESSEADDAWEIDDSGRVESFTDGAIEGDLDKLFFRFKELLEDVSRDYPKIMLEESACEHVKTKSVYMNTFGTTYDSEKGEYSFYIMYSGHEGERGSSFNSSGCSMDNLDKPFIETGMTRKDLSDTEKQIYTESVDEKFVGTAVFTPACLEDLVLRTILSEYISDRPLIEGTSPWKDKIGKKVCDERINLRLDPRDPRVICGGNYSGEGYINEAFDVIKDGVLQSFWLSQYGANKLSLKRSGNTTMHGITTPGEKSIEEIIAGIDKGIVFGRFSGGSPSANGEFSGVAKNSFLIENGKITKALSETMISGNLTEMLFKLVDISSETKEDGNSVTPYMAFDGLTISGK